MANTTILCPTLPVIFQRTGDVVDTKYETSRFLVQHCVSFGELCA